MMLHPDIPESWVLGTFGALVIGLRHKKCRGQAKKSLSAMFKSAKDFHPGILRLMAKMDDNFETLILNMFSIIECPEKTDDLREQAVRDFAFQVYGQCAINTVYNWETKDDVPLAPAYTLAAHHPGNFQKNPPLLMHILLLIPWIAKCEAEELYLPREIHEALHEPWSADEARKLLDDERDRLGKAIPVTVDKSPGRNDPCPCGSKKKYKKCCLRQSESQTANSPNSV
ncbi:MAG: SEC-C domain-containing protein [Deltaproteobacteria bacterium]|nr:SEC-C domain-containing protein [Deltaproteobacteria bacterium]